MPKRNLTLTLTLALAGAALFAAPPSADAIQAQIASEIQMLRAENKIDRRAILADSMDLTAAEAAAFWPIYDEYELASTQLDDVRLGLVKVYLESYDTLTPEAAQALAKGIFQYQMDRIKLSKKYFKRVSQALSPKRAARFVQIDLALRSIKDLVIQASLPLFK